MKPKVIVTVDPFDLDVAKFNQPLVDRGFVVHWEPSLANSTDTDKIIAFTKGYHYVMAGGELWNRKAIEANKGTLRMITRLGSGYDKVDVAAASRAGIAVATTPGANSATVAEHAVALMLSVLRGIPKYDRNIRGGQWTTAFVNQLYGKTVGFVGFGAIARKVAEMLQGFSTRLLAYDVVRHAAAAEKSDVRFLDLDQLLALSDIVSLHTPLTAETTGMVDRSFLKRMKPSAILINTSRGKVVKESDLIDALRSGTIAGAGLDVFEVQPLPAESPLTSMDQVVMSSHIGGMSVESYAAMVNGCVQNILDFHYGGKVKHLLNPDYAEVSTPLPDDA